MTDFSKEMDAFFDPLVGSEAAIADFRANLSEHIAPHADTPGAFLSLQEAAEKMIQLTISDINSLPSDSDGSTLPLIWKKVWANSLLGARSTAGVLTAVSDIYARHAQVPQAIDKVEKNTDIALRYVYGNAFNQGYTAVYNLIAMRTGRNPGNPFNRPLFLANLLFRDARDAAVHRRAFRVAATEDGQLDIKPRHLLVNSKSEKRCPATDARIAVAHESPSALLTFMRAIGSVAMQDIYPRRFGIAPSE